MLRFDIREWQNATVFYYHMFLYLRRVHTFVLEQIPLFPSLAFRHHHFFRFLSLLSLRLLLFPP